MTPERHRRLMDLFDEVCDLADGARQGRLAALRAEDGSLADDLARMLAADASSAAELDVAAQAIARDFTLVQPGAPPRAGAAVAHPMRIGPYAVRRVLGEGGMGVVYEGEQELPRRRVAIKVIRGQLATPALRKRFELESHILGRLAHPGICRIYEADASADSCYLAMELVDGKPLDATGGTVEERLELIAKVCDALHHAHLRGVIHLDLKPANILVQADGQPKVLDFGIARIVDPEEALTGLTVTGHVIGTPAYMSPEQTTVSADLLDARSDIYTLGAILFELLSGRMPHEVKGKAIPEIVRLIREDEPASLSQLVPALRGDVATIVAKALERDPERRYQTAAALAADLRRYLRREPIAARPRTAGYQIFLFARRNKGLAAALGALAVALVAGTVVSARMATRAERARAQLAVRNDALVLLEARALLLADPTRAAARLKTLSPDGSWDDALALAREAEARGVARHVLLGHESEVHAVAFSADGRTLATASYDRTVRLWDLAQRRERVVRLEQGASTVAYAGSLLAVGGLAGELRVIDGPQVRTLVGHRGRVDQLAWSPDGQTLASAGDDGTVRLWSRTGEGGAPLAGHRGRITAMAWSEDGATLATGGQDDTVRLWARDGKAGAVLRAHGDELAALIYVGGEVISAARDGRVIRWDAAGEPHLVGSTSDEIKLLVAARGRWPVPESRTEKSAARSPVREGASEELAGASDERATHAAGPAASSSTGGTQRQAIAWAGRDGLLWLLSPGATLARVVGRHDGVVRALLFSPDGRLLASGGDDRTVRLLDVDSGDRTTLLGHDAHVRGLAFSADGKQLASVADDGTARVWPVRAPSVVGARRVTASARGDVAVAGVDRNIRLRTAAGEERLLRGHGDEIYQLAFSPDGAFLASASRDHTVRVWPVSGEAPPRIVPCPGRAIAVAWSADGHWLGIAVHTGALVLWDARQETARTLLGHEDRASAVVFVGDTLISGSDDGSIRAWPPPDAVGRVVTQLPERVIALAVTREGRLAAASGDGSVYVLGLTEAPRLLAGHRGEVVAVAWSPDGTTLVSGGIDRTVRVWRDGRQVQLLGGAAAGVVTVGFAGDAVVWGDGDGTLRMSGERPRVLARGHGPVLDQAYLPDGRVAVITDEDGLRLVPAGSAPTAPATQVLLGELTAATVDDSGALAEPFRE